MSKFCRWELRTTDADGARAFYAKIFGHERAVIWPLHEQALARGARPHWLGHIGVPDVERAAAAFIERGAAPLGPARPMNQGGQAAVLRDPGGAVVAVATPLPPDEKASVEPVWHVLNTNDAAPTLVSRSTLTATKPTTFRSSRAAYTSQPESGRKSEASRSPCFSSSRACAAS